MTCLVLLLVLPPAVLRAESGLSEKDASTGEAATPADLGLDDTGDEPAGLEDLGLGEEDAPSYLDDIEHDESEGESAEPSDLGLDGFDLDDLDIEDEIALLYSEDMVVSATRHEQRISESPSTITVISREEIIGGWHRDIADILRMVPGGDVYRINPMTVNVGLRAGSSGTGNRVLLLIDGRDMALHTTGQPLWNALPVDLETIERIEVIRGPGSSIYGANAFQGVVNIITRRPTEDTLAVEGTASLAGLGTYNADARAHGSTEMLRWWVNAGYDEEASFEHPDRRGYRSHRARARLDFDLGDELEATVDAGYGGAWGHFASPAGDGPSYWHTPYLLAKLRWPSTELQLNVESTTASLEPENKLISPAGTLGEEPVLLGSVHPFELRSHSAELTGFHSIETSSGHRFMAGGAGRTIHHSKGALLVCPDVSIADFDIDDCHDDSLLELRGGAFIQAELQLTEKLALTTGLRADANSIHPELGISPRLAMVWTPDAVHAFRVSAGRAYRKPSFIESHLNPRYEPAEQGVPTEVASRLQYMFVVDSPNPDLRNETVSAVETGWLARFANGRLTTSIDLYGMRFDDRIEGVLENIEFVPGFGGSVTLSEDARVTYENRDLHNWSIGGEATITAHPMPWLRLDAHYNHQGVYYVQEEDGERYNELSTWTPRHRVNLAGQLRMPLGLNFALSAHWSSSYSRYIQNPESTLYPAITTDTGNEILVLGSASYTVTSPTGPLEIGVAGRNLLFSEIRELTGVSREERTWGGELIEPQARLFVRGRF